MPSFRKIFILFILSTIYVSCGFYSTRKTKPVGEKYSYYDQVDYLDHLDYLKNVFLSKVRTVKLNRLDNAYLKRIISNIVNKNVVLLGNNAEAKFHIIKDKNPYHFSLPGGVYFLSSGLLKKYIKHEEILVAILAYETIKSYKKVFRKKIIVPTGNISTAKLISLLNVPLEKRIELGKWTLYCLKRSGYDPYAFLSWLQIQNKNTLEFSLNTGSISKLPKEESEIKKYLILNKYNRKKRNSSNREFYRLLRTAKKG